MMFKIIPLCLITSFLSGCSVTSNTYSGSSGGTSAAVESKTLETIPVELTTHLGDQQHFVKGDEIQFLLSLGSDAYIHMFYIDAASQVTQILPSENQRSHFYTAGYFLTIPEYENHYRFIISEPFGEESIWIFASDRSIPIDEKEYSIKKIKQKIRQGSEQYYGQYLLSITTSDK